jgi:hypothetical protein
MCRCLRIFSLYRVFGSLLFTIRPPLPIYKPWPLPRRQYAHRQR